jgi:hypothetical protein
MACPDQSTLNEESSQRIFLSTGTTGVCSRILKNSLMGVLRTRRNGAQKEDPLEFLPGINLAGLSRMVIERFMYTHQESEGLAFMKRCCYKAFPTYLVFEVV